MVLPFWAKPLMLLLLVGALFGGWQWRESTVYKNGWEAAVAERKQQDDEHLAKATLRAQATERALRERMDADSLERQKEKVSYEKTIDDLRADARRGNSGMRAPGTCVPRDAARPDPGVAGRPVDQEGFQLLPETSSSVLDAARELREGVRINNALIEAYENMRAACNDPP